MSFFTVPSILTKLTYGLLLLTLSACQCSTEPRDAVLEIHAMVNRLAKAAEARSVDRVSEHLHDDFTGTGAYLGGNKSALKRSLQVLFIRRSEIFVLPHVRRIELNEDQSKAEIKLWVVVSRTRVDF